MLIRNRKKRLVNIKPSNKREMGKIGEGSEAKQMETLEGC